MMEELSNPTSTQMVAETITPLSKANINESITIAPTAGKDMNGQYIDKNCIKTTVGELIHFGLWGKYCRLMHIDYGSENLEETILLPDRLMEMMGI